MNIKKLSLRKCKHLVPGYVASKCENRDANPGQSDSVVLGRLT